MPIIGSLGAAASRGFGQFLQKITAVLNTDAFFKYVTLLLTGNPPVSTFVTDASTNNLQVTINGDTKPSGFSPNEGGYYSNYFSAGSNYLNTPSEIALSSDLTIELWFNLTSPQASYQMICGQNLSGGYGTYVSVNSLGIEFYMGGGPPPRIYYTFATNVWYHFALVRSGSTVSAYVNGVAQDVTIPTQTTTFYLQYVGISFSTAYPFTGYISNFRVVNGSAVYTSNFTPSTTPLTAITNTALLTCQSSRFIDNSASALALTVTGSPSVNSLQPFTPNPSFATYGSTYFDGSGDYLVTPVNSALAIGTGDFTIEFWMYANATQVGSHPRLLSNGVWNTTAGYDIAIESSLIQFRSGGGSAKTCTFTASDYSQWVHVAFSRSGTSFKVFKNGVLANTYTDSSNLTSTDSTYIAKYAVVTGSDFTGYMSNLRIVKGTAIYTSAFTPPTTQLTAVTNTSLLTCQTNQPVNNNVFLDSSSNNFPITRAGNTTQGSLNPYGGNWSVETGNGFYLTVPSNAALRLTGDFTIEAWIYPTTVSNNMIVGSDAGTNSDFFGITTNRIQIGIANGTYPTWATSFVPNTWYHVALTRSSNFLRAFVNGTQLTLASGSATNSGQMLQTAALFIGRYGYTVSQSPFYGNISNLRILKGTALYTASFTPPTAPLTAITNTSLLTCQSNRFVDNSLNNFTITATQNPKAQRFSPFSPILSTPTSYSTYFGTKTDYLSVSATTALTTFTSDFTFECWVNPTDTSIQYWGIWDSRESGGPTPMIFNMEPLSSPVTGSYRLKYYNGTTYYSTGSVLSNQWTHLAFVRSGSTLTFYINGVANGTATISGTQTGSATSNPIYIGTKDNGIANYGNVGYISNFRIVNGTAVYTSNFTPSTTPLTAIANTVLLTCQNSLLIDNSVNAYTITAASSTVAARTQNPFGVTNTDAPYTPATYGGSMYFDGTGDSLLVPYNSNIDISTGNFTIEAWCYATTTTNGVDSLWGYGGYGTMLYHSGTTWYWEVGNGGGNYFTITGTASLNAWHHIACTRLGSTFTLWIDGVSANTNTTSSALASSRALNIGLNITGGTQPFTGYISNFRIVKGTALYTANFAPPVAPLQAVTNTSLLLLGSNGAVYDSAIFNDAETVGDAKVSTAQSKFGGSSVSFDGSGDSLMIPASNRYQFQANYTIELWVYFNSVTGTQDIVGNYVSSTAVDWTLLIDNQTIQYYPSSAASFVWGPTMAINTWYHIALVRSGSTCSMYVNGVSVGTPLTFSTVLGSPTKPLYVGSRAGGSNYFNGYIDDLRITNGYARYTQNFSVPTEPFPVQ